jgi:hypothetical protein
MYIPVVAAVAELSLLPPFPAGGVVSTTGRGVSKKVVRSWKCVAHSTVELQSTSRLSNTAAAIPNPSSVEVPRPINPPGVNTRVCTSDGQMRVPECALCVQERS